MCDSIIFKPFTTIEQVMEYYPIGTVVSVTSKSNNNAVTGIVIGYSVEDDGNYITIGNRSFSVDDLCNNWLINGKQVGIEYVRREEPKKEVKKEEEPKRKSNKVCMSSLSEEDIKKLYEMMHHHRFDPFDDKIIREDMNPWDF